MSLRIQVVALDSEGEQFTLEGLLRDITLGGIAEETDGYSTCTYCQAAGHVSSRLGHDPDCAIIRARIVLGEIL